MLGSLLAGILISGQSEGAVIYRPTQCAPFSVADKVAEFLKFEEFEVAPGGVTFVWKGSTGELAYDDGTGVLTIKNSKHSTTDVLEVAKAFDIKQERVRIRLTAHRMNNEDQTVVAEVSHGSPVKLSAGPGLTEMTIFTRRNEDKTVTVSGMLSRVYRRSNTDSGFSRSSTFVARTKLGEALRMGTSQRNTGDEKNYLSVASAGPEAGTSFEIVIEDLAKN